MMRSSPSLPSCHSQARRPSQLTCCPLALILTFPFYFSFLDFGGLLVAGLVAPSLSLSPPAGITRILLSSLSRSYIRSFVHSTGKIINHTPQRLQTPSSYILGGQGHQAPSCPFLCQGHPTTILLHHRYGLVPSKGSSGSKQRYIGGLDRDTQPFAMK